MEGDGIRPQGHLSFLPMQNVIPSPAFPDSGHGGPRSPLHPCRPKPNPPRLYAACNIILRTLAPSSASAIAAATATAKAPGNPGTNWLSGQGEISCSSRSTPTDPHAGSQRHSRRLHPQIADELGLKRYLGIWVDATTYDEATNLAAVNDIALSQGRGWNPSRSVDRQQSTCSACSIRKSLTPNIKPDKVCRSAAAQLLHQA